MATQPPSPPLEPLSLDEVKLNLRITSTSEDDLLDGMIVDAREFVERATGYVLTPRSLTETSAQLGRYIELSSWPVTSVAQIRYPSGGVMAPLPPAAWQTSYLRRPVRILPTAGCWGVSEAYAQCDALPVEIDVQAGYASPDQVPRVATRAMHMLIAHWYSNRATAEVGTRAAAIEVPFGVTKLLEQLQLQRV